MFESIALRVMDFIIGINPVLGVIFMALGVIFLLCEAFVKATPSKTDDQRWESFKSGYIGPFINLFIGFAKRKLTTKK